MNYVIVDLEATCWVKGTRPGRQEIIEIGAIFLESKTLKIVKEFQSFVKPIARPDLSEFCKELTSIQQSDVDSASDFKTVLIKFLEWIGNDSYTLCSWGAYDIRQFKTDCRRHDIQFPESFHNHLNLKKMFAELKNCKPCVMKQALRTLNIPLDGTHHRGIDDARNLAKIARIILPQL